MVLMLHIFLALGSLAYTTYLYVSPSPSKLKIAYVTVLATLASGSYLVWSTKSPLLQACTMGLLYTTVVTFGIALAQKKLVASQTK